MRLLPYGDRALLVELGSTEEALAWSVALDRLGPATLGVEQVVPAARTVLVALGPDGDLAGLRRALTDLEVGPVGGGSADSGDSGDSGDAGEGASEVVEVPVVYDGDDLDDVARLTGLDVEEVVAAHTGQTWRVAFGGFAPGFGYLLGEDDRLHVPRRDEARTRVPAGAVGLAGPYSGIYPSASPGGWQLLGRTTLRTWDLDRDPPALLRPGVRVRFTVAGTA